METTRQRDERLWRIAKARAGFKCHLIIYLVINMGLWMVWLLSDRDMPGNAPWPLGPSLGWGIALTLQYFNTYHKGSFDDTLKRI